MNRRGRDGRLWEAVCPPPARNARRVIWSRAPGAVVACLAALVADVLAERAGGAPADGEGSTDGEVVPPRAEARRHFGDLARVG